MGAERSLAPVIVRLRGQALCLKKCLQALVDHGGLDPFVQGILPHRTLDTAISCIVGDQRVDEASFRVGLASYVADLRCSTRALLR